MGLPIIKITDANTGEVGYIDTNNPQQVQAAFEALGAQPPQPKTKPSIGGGKGIKLPNLPKVSGGVNFGANQANTPLLIAAFVAVVLGIAYYFRKPKYRRR